MATVITVKSKNQNQISTLNPNEQSRKDINLNNQNHNAIIIINAPIYDNRIHHKQTKMQMES